MHIKSLAVILLASWLTIIHAQSANVPSRYYRLAYYNTPAKVKAIESLESINPAADLEDEEDLDDDEYIEPVSRKKNSASTGRLFFKRLFGQSQQSQQPIIIVTGGNTGTGSTTTGSIPSATGTISTSPITSRGYEEEEEQDGGSTAANAADEEKLEAEAAGAVAAQEYVVTHADIKGTGSDASMQFTGNNINLRQKGRPGRGVSVRIPNRYRKYFKNGQKVYLSRPNRRRRNRNRNRRNRNRNRNRPTIIN